MHPSEAVEKRSQPVEKPGPQAPPGNPISPAYNIESRKTRSRMRILRYSERLILFSFPYH